MGSIFSPPYRERQLHSRPRPPPRRLNIRRGSVGQCPGCKRLLPGTRQTAHFVAIAFRCQRIGLPLITAPRIPPPPATRTDRTPLNPVARQSTGVVRGKGRRRSTRPTPRAMVPNNRSRVPPTDPASPVSFDTRATNRPVKVSASRGKEDSKAQGTGSGHKRGRLRIMVVSTQALGPGTSATARRSRTTRTRQRRFHPPARSSVDLNSVRLSGRTTTRSRMQPAAMPGRDTVPSMSLSALGLYGHAGWVRSLAGRPGAKRRHFSVEVKLRPRPPGVSAAANKVQPRRTDGGRPAFGGGVAFVFP